MKKYIASRGGSRGAPLPDVPLPHGQNLFLSWDFLGMLESYSMGATPTGSCLSDGKSWILQCLQTGFYVSTFTLCGFYLVAKYNKPNVSASGE